MMMPLGEGMWFASCTTRIVSLDSGKTIVRCDHLDTGTQSSSIICDAKLPVMAVDAENRLFAVAGANEITVIQVEM
jgi:hypothetical protein